MSSNRQYDLARDVQSECIQTALAAYESAAISGLCGEGAFEAAVSAMRMLNIESVVDKHRKDAETDNNA